MPARMALLAVVLLAGCGRSFYRRSADRETYPIIAERVVLPTYHIGRTQLEPPPGSRLADPFDPDHPPKPPDDPAAALFMARPGGMRGAWCWAKDGVTPVIEPPGWEQVLGLDASGTLKLDQDKAVEIALLDSREYQSALETIYLSALALTLNRYEFDLQWFGRNATTFTHFGSGSVPTETNTLEVNSNLGFTRNLAAGGQLLVDFANSLVYQFAGPDQRRFGSNLVITLIQPLLRGAGRKVRLEGLTQAERDVLYAVRDFARFRKQFWAGIATGAGGGGGFGGSGFTAGLGGGGYLDLLLAVQRLRNSRANLKRQDETYSLYNELFRGGRASVVELDQFYQSFLGARQDVVDAEVSLQSAQDSFKLRLGLPPRLPVELDDALLRQFELADPSLDQLRDDLEAFQRDRLKELDAPPAVPVLRQHFAALRGYADRIPAAVRQAAADLEKWGRQLDRPARSTDDDQEQQDRDRAAFERLKKELPGVTTDLAKLVRILDEHRANVTEPTRKAAWETLTTDIKSVLALIDTVLTVQTEARIYLIELPQVEVKEADALVFAKENRLDLQNRLGTVTDAWRKVWVAANALRGDLNIVTTANLGTDPDHLDPFNFAAEASLYSVGLRFDGPLNRQAERNAYRASLIGYQRAKRAYVELSDLVEFQVREDLRQLNRLRVGFAIARQQLLSAARQYESARLILLGPRDRRTANDTTTLNLLQALSALLSARNALAASYINFEQQRIQLLLDLEALQLDQRGFPTNVSIQPADLTQCAPGRAAAGESARQGPASGGREPGDGTAAPELAPRPRPAPPAAGPPGS